MGLWWPLHRIPSTCQITANSPAAMRGATLSICGLGVEPTSPRPQTSPPPPLPHVQNPVFASATQIVHFQMHPIDVPAWYKER